MNLTVEITLVIHEVKKVNLVFLILFERAKSTRIEKQLVIPTKVGVQK